ncbi:hypothetical protein D3C87_2129330 [compost metagenome]
MTAYSRAVRDNEPSLYQNNFVLNREDKKEFMEKPDVGFSICISIGSAVHRENVVQGGNTRNKYDGRIAEFTEFTHDFML